MNFFNSEIFANQYASLSRASIILLLGACPEMTTVTLNYYNYKQ